MSERNLIPCTHWAFFDGDAKAAAEACARDLELRYDCLTLIDRALTFNAPKWRLRAARPANWGHEEIYWHKGIEEVVERYGGEYCGGDVHGLTGAK